MLRTAAAFTAMLSLSAMQADGEEFVIMGFGTATCAKMAELYRVAPDRADNDFFLWAQGYMSGFNNARIYYQLRPRRNLNGTPIKSQEVYLRRYCDQHPLAQVLDAVESLYNSLPPVLH